MIRKLIINQTGVDIFKLYQVKTLEASTRAGTGGPLTPDSGE